IPARLPDDAVRIMAGLQCELVDDDEIEACWTTTLADEPNEGVVRESVKSVAQTVFSDGAINDVA
ncbi:MAG: hypothetical protein OEM63_10630, partial [Gammaproteobacteria bacterium]|nr:hypothetical protein [Gammaproteobacteria bacterium]